MAEEVDDVEDFGLDLVDAAHVGQPRQDRGGRPKTQAAQGRDPQRIAPVARRALGEHPELDVDEDDGEDHRRQGGLQQVEQQADEQGAR